MGKMPAAFGIHCTLGSRMSLRSPVEFVCEICRTHGLRAHTDTGTYDVSLTTHQWTVKGTMTTAATVVSEGQLPMLILHKTGREKLMAEKERGRNKG